MRMVRFQGNKTDGSHMYIYKWEKSLGHSLQCVQVTKILRSIVFTEMTVNRKEYSNHILVPLASFGFPW